VGNLPRELAAALIEKRDIRKPSEIRIDLLAFAEGASVLFRKAGHADARVALAGGRAIIAVPEWARGTPRARYSIAHELGHFLLHPDLDAVARIHGLPRTEAWEYKCEWEANEFARHVVVPTRMAAPMCQKDLPTLADVGELAREFTVSLSVSGHRWPEMSPAPCALVEAKGGVIKWVTRSPSFRGDAVRGRVLPDGALALDLLCGWSKGERTRVHRVAWGAAHADAEIVEECVPLSGGTTLVWLLER
jgi:hypothetical protein